MIVDRILDRKDGALCGETYSAHDFYMDCMSYGRIADDITRAMDGGTEEDVKEALCAYVLENEYNSFLCDYIRRINWLGETHPAVEMAAAMEFNWVNAARHGERSNRVQEFSYECGVLVGPEYEEFSSYAYNNPSLPYGFFDEDQGLVVEHDLSKTLDEMRKYVEDGVDKTYAIVALQGSVEVGSDEYKDIVSGEGTVDGISYAHFRNSDRVLWSICKMDGRLVEGFLEDMLQEKRLDVVLGEAEKQSFAGDKRIGLECKDDIAK